VAEEDLGQAKTLSRESDGVGAVKGLGIKAIYGYLSSIQGPRGMEKIAERLSEADRKIFLMKVLDNTWVDYGYYMRMIVIADQVLGKGDLKLIENVARFNMGTNFRGLYKMMISALGVRASVNRAQNAWNLWFDVGKLSVTWLGEKKALLTLTEYPGMPLNHELNITPSIDECIRIAGGKNTMTRHLKCYLKGDGCCTWEVSWD
jgi:hypothetical protein